jgi:sensor histidine kinase YesM
MRYLLYESGRGTTTLKKETEFIKSYVNLMQLRFDKNVTIDLELPTDLNDISLPPLLFVSFIENAFKHGISYRERSSISFKLLQKPDTLEFISVNTIPSHKNATIPVSGNGGIGLENIRKRLDLLYKERYNLEILKKEHEFRVHLTLHFGLILE